MTYPEELDYPEAADFDFLVALHASVEFLVKMETVTEIHIFP
jgi:hypothetical protein